MDVEEARVRDDGEVEYVEYVRSRLPMLRRAAHLLSGDWERGDDIVQSALTDAGCTMPTAHPKDQ